MVLKAALALAGALMLSACGGGTAGDDGPRVRDDAQRISFAAAPTLQAGGGATLAAGATSGLAVSFSSLTPAVCSIDAATGVVMALRIGDCSVAANQGGNDRFAPAPQATLTVPVAGRPQALSVDAAPALAVDDTAVLRAAATSGLAVRFSSQTPATCRVDADSGAVTGLASGPCDVVMEQAGDSQWAAAAPATQTLAVAGRAQALAFTALPPLLVGASTAGQAVASSGLAVTWASLTPAVCSVSDGGSVRALAAGTCSIAADQAGDDRWARALQVQQATAVSRAPQAVAFSGAVPALTVGSAVTLRAVATSGLPVGYASATGAVCSVDAASGVLSPLASGSCTVTAGEPGDVAWAPATPASLTMAVAGMTQTLSFAAAPVLTVNGSATALATASSGLAASHASLTPSTCSVSAAGAVSGLAIGHCTVAASQAGNSTWAPAPQATQAFAVAGMAQTLSFAAAPALTVGGTATVRATASSGLAVSYSSASASVCSVHATSGLVTSLTMGACTIAASQAGNTSWAAAAQVVQTLGTAAAAQALAFGTAPALVVNGSATVRATASSGLAAAYSSLSGGLCSVGSSSGVVTGLAIGQCVVAANQAGNTTWAPAAQATLTLSVTGMAQTIDFAAAPALAAGGSATVRATATSGLAVRYSSLTPSLCSVSAGSGVVSASAPGSCSIAADQAGNTAWAAAPQVIQTLAVGAAAQSISFGAAPALTAGGTATVRAVATSGLAVSYLSLSGSVCSVQAGSGVVTGLAAGSCTVAANQAGSASWAAAAQAMQTLVVAPNPVQSLAFSAAPALTLGGTATVSATASSGLAVTYSSLSPTVCGVSAAGLVTSLSMGDCVVAANQPGNASYNPAPQALQTLPVQLPAGVSAPAAPQGVTATLGSSVASVVVGAASVGSGGSAITGYTVTSRPAGITVQAASLPVTVACPTSCAGYAFSVLASNVVGAGSASAAVDVLTTFDVLTRFQEPDTQPRDTVFTGSFTLNSTTGAVTGLTGRLTEAMTGNATGTAPYYDMTQVTLAYQLQSWRDSPLGGTFVASFAKNTTSTFTTSAGGDGWSPQAGIASGAVYAGFPTRHANTIQNSSVLIFVPGDPFTPLTAPQIAKLAYADCAPGGIMGAGCMTGTSLAGYGAVGTMSGYPVAQQISRR